MLSVTGSTRAMVSETASLLTYDQPRQGASQRPPCALPRSRPVTMPFM